jgi:cytochrome c biogenesis protein CcmG, thiol:disulfide interchange protein DsbE
MSDGAPNRRRLPLAALAPLALFIALALFFLVRLVTGGDLTVVPSALIGKPAPATALEPFGTHPPLAHEAFKGRVTIVNVWASWCAPCRDEHPLLVELSKDDRFTLAGINYKDAPLKAEGFLAELGDPFDEISADPRGRAAIDWGVYGVPETFIVGRDGMIAYKHVGPLSDRDLAGPFRAALEAALAQAPGATE